MGQGRADAGRLAGVRMNNGSGKFSLAGKKGLILGVANDHSIAWSCARLAREQGAELVATCVNEKALKFVQPLTGPAGIDLQVCDVSQPGALQALVAHAVARLGRLDFVVHSIAWAPLADLHGRVVDSSSAGFASAMDISCHSFAALAGLCAPHMTEGGSLLTMTYLGADEVVPNYGIMGPVKAALESMVRYIALELGPQRIRVHAVSAGPVETRAASGIASFDELMENAKRKSPLGRLVTMDEIAQLCVFLCADASSGMTGQTIYVDAGCHAMA